MNTLLVSLYGSLSALATGASAQVFNGSGLEGGVNEAAAIEGPAHGTIREVILSMLYTVLSFLALASVIMVIIAGIMMVMSGGKEETKERAKKIILYVIIGLIVVLFARAVVGFFLNGLP